MPSKKAIVIGAGIVGLAMARSLAERGYSVVVFERNEKAVGASIRNFGMIWPIGQPNGKLYDRALKTKATWKKICNDAGLWFEEKGSLHLAYNALEWQVLQEFESLNEHRPLKLIEGGELLKTNPVVNPQGLYGGLFSGDEMIIESRVAMKLLPSYLQKKYGVQFFFNTAISSIAFPFVYAGKNKWVADEIFVCSGADFNTLYPAVFIERGFTKCKLQMMRLGGQPSRIGPALCGGLSLIHYKSFEAAASLPHLKEYFQKNLPEHVKWGIHVMVSQNAEGELTIGDSHEYGLVHDPFDKQSINQLIIDYLSQFALFQNRDLIQSWNGTYAKMKNGHTQFVFQPEEGVTIINGLGGAGMTLSFGLAEEVITSIERQTLKTMFPEE